MPRAIRRRISGAIRTQFPAQFCAPPSHRKILPARRYNAPDLLHSLLTKLADSLALSVGKILPILPKEPGAVLRDLLDAVIEEVLLVVETAGTEAVCAGGLAETVDGWFHLRDSPRKNSGVVEGHPLKK